ncbi:MAG: lipoprotein [Giesbergeria sp.]|uniref:LPS translocon maturation chaperone LptM n=1 Tax=Giesbergeria sp. TaxID=2818473 RepID=UPI00261B2328|nr:lipoprotein [Giesbergeria sp.]MDD2609295.1 lipoprotein [Giesbergeria sp.]
MLKAFQILVRRFVLVASVAATLAACGQRGPLYLPTPAAPAAPSPASPATSAPSVAP